ncbi:aminotransferase class V-fold PLP-dependent enzyme [Syntrophothermus sp.]|uniref:aminotransferase class V-fold PLP-dependent enzyme n=1 Tax=Syntrophothermus sp. TaxID=2736299 RepID=UPI002580BC1E|nr:aminotransferase class V-fold PLP-dependent enzyme [Syntrophothermus sp.]
MRVIYLDNAATSYPKPESVYEAVDRFNRYQGGNPGRGASSKTLAAGSVLMEAREALAKLFNVKESSHIAFTLNVTEALNVGLKGILEPGDHVITTSMEHNAVARPLHVLRKKGVEWTAVPCHPDGLLDPEEVKKAIQPNTRMICVLHASNLTGTIMPIAEIGRIAKDNGIIFMVDSAQTAGVLSIDVEAQNIDILCFTGHKALLGPQGTGGIYVRPGLLITPLKEGGTGSKSEFLEQPEMMPDLLESGTPNTPGTAGLLAGVNFVMSQGLERIREHEQKLTEMLISGLKEIPGVELYGPEHAASRTAVVPFNIENVDCGEVSLILDQKYGIVTRSGLHCAPLAHGTVGTLKKGAVRMSLGYFTSVDDVETAIKAVYEIARERY